MKAVAYKTPGPIEREDALQDITLDNAHSRRPRSAGQGQRGLGEPGGHESAPARRARRRAYGGCWAGTPPASSRPSGPRSRCSSQAIAVFYAGSIARPGTNSEFTSSTSASSAASPPALSIAEAAALPLTAITAWEMLFDRLDVKRPTRRADKTILVIGGAGGVGSITIQLLRALTDSP